VKDGEDAGWWAGRGLEGLGHGAWL
jgi:hypothetical protein